MKETLTDAPAPEPHGRVARPAPSISIVISTLNSAATLDRCLREIVQQDYPKQQLEILICDGGSTDATRKIAARHGVSQILESPLKSGEAGKAVGLKHAKGELIAFIDSDNFLVGADWLKRMVAPFQSDPQIVLAEPLRFHWDPSASPIMRYCALMGLNDPLCYYTGNFDRWNLALQKWTRFDIPTHDCGDWFWFELSKEDSIPTLGANGTIYRRKTLEKLPAADYFFDVDIPHQLLESRPQRFAKVRTEIFHWYCPTGKDFLRKQKRRILDYLYHRKSQSRTGHPQSYSLAGIVFFILSVLLVIPALLTSLAGYRQKPDCAWFLHWPLSAATLWMYGINVLRFLWNPAPMNRENWQTSSDG